MALDLNKALRSIVRERPGQIAFAILIVLSLSYVIALELKDGAHAVHSQKYDPLEDRSALMADPQKESNH